MANYLIKTVCLTLLLFLYSCNNDANDKNPIVKPPIPIDDGFTTFCNFDKNSISEMRDYYEQHGLNFDNYISEIDSDISLYMKELIEDSKRTFHLIFFTERQYGSGSHQLRYCVSKNWHC